ncbi:MAG: protein-methionine-sulfoxide reductase heme-binding subunit MsrQ [Myxococcota bacterium]
MSEVLVRGKIQLRVAILLAALPLLGLLFGFSTQVPGPNPIEEITHLTGRWALRLILLSLAITPARQFLGIQNIAPLRRLLGLAGFSYACLHLATWALLDHGLDSAAILEDLIERRYILVGMSAFSILLILAFTSTRASMKRLGQRWKRLHQAVYLAAILAVVHQFWLIKADYRPAIVHAGILGLLLGARLVWRARHQA